MSCWPSEATPTKATSLPSGERAGSEIWMNCPPPGGRTSRTRRLPMATRGRAPLERLVGVGDDVEPVADAVLRREDEDVRPDRRDGVLDGVERLDPRHAVRRDLHRALRVAQVDDVEPRPAAAPVDAAHDGDGAVGRGGEVLGLVGEAADLPDLRQVLLRPQVLRVVAALHPRAPALIHLLQRLVQHAAHEGAEAPGRRRRGARVRLAEEVGVLVRTPGSSRPRTCRR